MLSLVDKNPIMESNPQKLNNNTQEAVELLGLSSSDSLDSPSFTHFQAPKQKRKVRFKKPFRSSSRAKTSRSNATKNCKCNCMDSFKILSYIILLAVVGALLWYVMTLSTRVQELQAKFVDFEAGNRNTPEALHVIHSSLKQLDSNVTMLFLEVRKNMAEIDNITVEVTQLKGVAANIKESIAAAPAIQQLPKDVHALSESVANFGSKMNALESNVKELKDQQSNLQTTAQNLSGELETMKGALQDITNATEVQTKSASMPLKDSKLQTTLQETNQHVDLLQGQLNDVVSSIGKLNATCNSYRELPAKVDTINDAVIWINNATNSQNTRLSYLESFVMTNLTLRVEQSEPERALSFQSPGRPDVDDYVNRTVSEVIMRLINQDIFHKDIQIESSNSLQSVEQCHDVLMLFAALLRKFDQIPKAYILNNKNATDLVEKMLQESFEKMVTSQDIKIEAMEQEIRNLSLCIQSSHPQDSEPGHLSDVTTPVLVQSTYKTEKVSENDEQLKQVLE